MSAEDPNDHRLDHVVVLMFENRSFDNLLGYLYGSEEMGKFEGVGAGAFSNPTPPTIANGGSRTVAVHPAKDMATPYPDPGKSIRT